ncbi:type 2 periplasmic-binding domain-containing protein [Actinomadura algeriensis]|uniref:hypothetical protein n=1 Tax=Actinomadura algeriensis TaxID=1679523 RepID=UPI001CEF01D3|nr:hypothetical protein [Actinomadura algeriensis]
MLGAAAAGLPPHGVGHRTSSISDRIRSLEGPSIRALALIWSNLTANPRTMEHRISQVLAKDEMCPAVGAGVVGVQCRKSDEGIVELLQMVDHAVTRNHVLAERTMLHALQGHCNSPIAGHCHTTEDGQLSLIGMVFSRDGATFAYAHEWDSVDRAYELGAYVAATLTRKDARSIIAGTGLG